jgi:hypothetical protein
MSEKSQMKKVKEELVAEAKKRGIDLGEEAVAEMVKLAFAFAPKLASASKHSAWLSPIAAMLQSLKGDVMEMVDKIDGEDDGR